MMTYRIRLAVALLGMALGGAALGAAINESQHCERDRAVEVKLV